MTESTEESLTFESSDQAMRYFVGLQAQIVDKQREMQELTARYQQETQEYFGIADGKPMNILQLVTLVQRLRINGLL